MGRYKLILNADNYYFNNGLTKIIKGVILPIILSLFSFYSCFIGNISLGYISILATCVYLLVCSFNTLLPTMLYLSMFAYIYNIDGLMLYGFICFVYILRCSMKSRRLIYILLWFALYTLTHLISSALTFANITPILCIFTLLLATINYKRVDYRNCFMMFILGTLINSFLGLLKHQSVNISSILSEDITEGVMTDSVTRYAGLVLDPNFYSVIAIVSLMLLLFDKQQKSWFVLIILGFILYFGLTTYSKSFILSLFILFFLLILDNQKQKLFRIMLLGGVILFFLASIFNEIIGIIMLRFESANDFNSLTTGRDTLWKFYWEIIRNSSIYTLLFGHEILKGVAAAHNTYIELLYRFGIIGILFDFFLIKECFKNLNKKSFSLVDVGILGIIAVLLFNLSAYTFPMLWSCLFMVLILISHRSEKQYSYISMTSNSH